MERVGGVAGFGTTRSRLRSHGQCDLALLSRADVQSVEQLFQASEAVSLSAPDAFCLRLTRSGTAGTETIVVPESVVPAALLRFIRDELI